MNVLECMLKVLDLPARKTHPPKETSKGVKFVLIMDMCRDPGAFDLTDNISETDRNKTPWCFYYLKYNKTDPDTFQSAS